MHNSAGHLSLRHVTPHRPLMPLLCLCLMVGKAITKSPLQDVHAIKQRRLPSRRPAPPFLTSVSSLCRTSSAHTQLQSFIMCTATATRQQPALSGNPLQISHRSAASTGEPAPPYRELMSALESGLVTSCYALYNCLLAGPPLQRLPHRSERSLHCSGGHTHAGLQCNAGNAVDAQYWLWSQTQKPAKPPSAATLRYDAPLLCISSFAGQKCA